VAGLPSCQIAIRVIPRARRTIVDGRRGDAVLVRLAAPPVDGAANEALLRALADWLRLPRHAVSLLQGERARDKRVRVEGLSQAEVFSRLGL
jgi:uncharacterized protein (TIGR00251 family)